MGVMDLGTTTRRSTGILSVPWTVRRIWARASRGGSSWIMKARSGGRVPWIAGITAMAIAGIDLGVLPRLPAPAQQRLGLLLLPASALCLLAVGRRARRPHRHRESRGPTSPATRTGQAVGGPCDGQPLTLPADRPVPTEIWLRDKSDPDGAPVHRYLLDRGPGGVPRYDYAPPD